jgi:glycosyltransferase involved in cell wall biosynthesis
MTKNNRVYFVATVDFVVNAFLLNHFRVLSKKFDITLIVNTNNPLFLDKQGLSIKVIPMGIARDVDILSDINCLIHLIYIFIKNRPAAVHSITPKAGLLAMLAAFIARIPFRVHTFTGQVWVSKHGFKRIFLKFFDMLIARLATSNIVDSKSQQKFLIKEKVLNEETSTVFGHGSVSGVDLNRFKPSTKVFADVRKSLMIPEGAFIFTYLGRLNKDKGIIDLACAFSLIENTNAYLLVVGPDEGGFVEEIKKINAHKIDQIRFVGLTEIPERYLAASNALCLPSYREGFGTVIIEAAAVGIPAIASNIYGISDAIVSNETGLLHIMGDVPSILFCLNVFLNDQNLVMKYSCASRSRAISLFDASLISDQWFRFYSRNISCDEL